MRTYLNVPEARPRRELMQLSCPERRRDRDAAVMQRDRMPSEDPSGKRKKCVWNRVPLEIGYDYGAARQIRERSQQRHDPLILEMMQK